MNDLKEKIAESICDEERRPRAMNSPGPIWGGWWLWEPAAGKEKEGKKC